MATYSANGSGSQFFNYMHARVEVTRTDYSTYSAFSVVCKVVSDGGSSSFIAGRATASSSGSYGSYSSEQSVSAYGSTTLKTQTFNVNRGTSATTLTCKASILGGGTGMYAGKYDEATVSVTIPAISYDVPNPPTGASATYVDDSSTTLSWTNGTTTATKPRTATVVERQTDGGAWAQVASVSASATGYTDNGTEQNHSYAWRVAAQNSVGLSTYSTTSTVYTTPAPPASVTLDKTSATAVTVDVTGSMPYATGYDVQSTYDNGATWQTDATGVSMPYAATVGAGTVIFRVRSTRGALESAWTQSAALVTITPPLAPTITQAPANPTAYGDSDTISWSPNHPDGSAQAKAEIKVTNPGGTSTTYTVNGTGTSYTLTPNATGTWTAQVRTKGLDATMGAWSSTVSWTVANPPAVVITTPASDGATIAAMPLTIDWTVTDGTGVSAQRVIVTDTSSGQELYNKQLASNVTSLSLSSSDLTLENGGSYGITVRVMGGSGLVTVQTRTFQVSWTAPAEPMLAIYEGDGGSASIDVILPSSSGSGETVEFSEGGIVTSLSIEGKSVQDGTPTPSTPVAIESVQSTNLLDYDLWATVGVHHGTGVFEDNGVTITATSNDAYTNREFPEAARIPVSEGETVYLAWDSEDNISGTCYIFGDGGTSSMASRNNNAYRSVIYTVPAGITYVTFRLGVGTSGNIIHYRNVRVTKTPSPYMPKDGISVASQSRNLFTVTSNSSSTNGVTRSFDHETGILEWHGTATVNNTDLYMPFAKQVFVPNGATITVSVLDGTATTTNYLPTVFLRSTNGVYVEYVMLNAATRSATFSNVGGQVIEGVLFRVNPNYGEINISSRVMMEVGSTATKFEPYQGTTTPIDLQGNALRSLPDGTRDELTVDAAGNPAIIKRCEETYQAVTDGVTGTVGVDVLSSTGQIADSAQVIYKLATPQTISLGTITPPYIPDESTVWVDAEVTPEIDVTIRNAPSPTTPATDSVDVLRVNADGTTWTVATDLADGASCIDPLPPLGVPVEYRAVASAASGATATATFTETIGGKDWTLNFGNAAQEFMSLRYNPDASYALVQGGASYHFADGGAGGGRPVFYPTTDRDESGGLKFATIGSGDADRLRDLCDRYPVAWLRDPFGHRWRARVKPSWSHGVGELWPLSISWDAVRWEEAW